MLYLFCLAGLAASVPLPQLTLEEFQSRGRSLEAPIVLVSQPYATVRRQGRMGSSQNIKFPTLEVRDPNELTFASPIQNIAFAAGPVYKSNNEVSTKDIEAKIKEINAAEVIAKEEEVLEEELEIEIDELTDIAAAEIVAEEIEAAEIIAEEIAEEIVKEEIEKEIDELTDIMAAEIVAEEINEEILELEVESLTGLPELIEEFEVEEGSGNVPVIDFGDIMEVIL